MECKIRELISNVGGLGYFVLKLKAELSAREWTAQWEKEKKLSLLHFTLFILAIIHENTSGGTVVGKAVKAS